MTWEIRKVQEDSSEVDTLLLHGWEPFAVHTQTEDAVTDDYLSADVECVYLWLKRKRPLAERPDEDW